MLKSGPPFLGGASQLRTPEPVEGELDLWALHMSSVDAKQLDLSLLDITERHQAARLSRPEDRLSYVATHILLRQLLGERLGVQPHQVAYSRERCPSCGGPHGRPALARPPSALHFSMSRRGDTALIGIAVTRVGVDVEAVPEKESVAEVSALLHASERAEVLSGGPPAERAARFARLWARKEAYLKAIGVGISAGLAAEYVGIEQEAGRPPGWTLLDVPAPAGYAAAAAVGRAAGAGGVCRPGGLGRVGTGPSEPQSPKLSCKVVGWLGARGRGGPGAR